MKPSELLAFLVAIFTTAFFSLWLGAGLGLTACAASPDGYSHKFFAAGHKVYCEFRK
jgi:hypothetical protein